MTPFFLTKETALEQTWQVHIMAMTGVSDLYRGRSRGSDVRGLSRNGRSTIYQMMHSILCEDGMI